MKQEEQIVEDYLKSEGLSDIVYEPDGRIPPDFSVSSRIGVEVRRLNQRFTGNTAEGLEEKSNSLLNCVDNVLREYDAAEPVDSFLVSVGYHRPIGRLRQIRANLKRIITAFLSMTERNNYDFAVSNNVHVTFRPVHTQSPKRFLRLFDQDCDSGGPLAEIYEENIRHCIDEKRRKTQPYLSRYSEWWLVLVDAIGWGWGNYPDGVLEITKNLKKPVEWKRILLVDSVTLAKRLEL